MNRTRAGMWILWALCASCSEPALDWNVLVISLDTTRADHLGPFGGRARTPALDALAAESLVFSQAQTAATTTLCAHTSLMTGTWPHTHGVVRNGFTLHEENETLAEVLGAAGYDTRAFLGSFALERRFGFDQGFRVFDETFDLLVGAGGADQNQRLAPRVTAAVLQSLVEQPAPRGWFVFAHYFDPHAPYDPPPAWRQRLRAIPNGMTGDPLTVERAVRAGQARVLGEGPLPGLAGTVQGGLSRALLEGHEPAPAPLDESLAALYRAEVEALDASLGALFDGLEQSGDWDRTVVVLTGDHGETFTEHADRWNHGLGVWQTTAHVPLMIRVPPSHPAHARVQGLRAEPVSTIDVLPTLCGLLGLNCPGRVEGQDLLASSSSPRPVFTEATQPWMGLEEQAAAQGRWANWLKPHAVSMGRWRYHNWPYLQLELLYDLERDPEEQHNLLAGGVQELGADAAEALQSLRAELATWLDAARPLPSAFDASQTEETAQRLSQMGYGSGMEKD